MEPIQVYNHLENFLTADLHSFKTDLTKHDKKSILDNPGTPFIHCTRSTGTTMFMLHEADKYPDHDDPVPYMLGKATRREILKGNLNALKYSTKENTVFFFYNGTFLSRITPEKAIRIYKDYQRKIIHKWEGTTAQIPRDRIFAI